MTENEKSLKEIEGMIELATSQSDKAAYEFQKQLLEEAIAKEREQAAPAIAPIQQVTTQAPPSAPVQQEAAPLPVIPKIRVSVGGREIGAFEREEVIRRIRSGEIRKDARVLRDGMDDWVNAGDLPELETYFDEMKGFYAAEENRKREAEQAVAKAKTRTMDDARSLYKAGNYAEAVPVLELFTKFFGEASFLLGVCYEEGKGVKQDYKLAFNWYKKAEEQGYSEAKKAAKKVSKKFR
jgi:hypothetical protein